METNRREALKMLGTTFLGAALGGGATYADIKSGTEYTANAMANGYHAFGKFTDVPHEELQEVAQSVLENKIGQASVLSATVGALTFNALHRWIWKGKLNF